MSKEDEKVSAQLQEVGQLLANKKNVLVMIGGSDPENLTTDASIFTLENFQKNPELFVEWVGKKLQKPRVPTASHRLIAELAERGMLLRCYTANVDNVECAAGVPQSLMYFVRGNLESASCSGCEKPQNILKVRADWRCGQVSKCKVCKQPIKPNVLFFGEKIPASYATELKKDIDNCDCLLVLGLGFKMNTFESIITCVPKNIPRILVNDTHVSMEDLKKSDVTQLETALKNLEDQKAQLTKRLEDLQVDTSDRDTNVILNCDKFSRKVLRSLGCD
jgi:NAD-dependent SIR2 family protein deacetylase